MATIDKVIQVEDIGPIDNLRFVAPEGGGVIVLRGPNGAGKSTALDAITAAAAGKGKLPIKDGADRGQVRLSEVTLKVGKTNRRSGELDVSVIPGKYTIADLIAPGYKDRDACDEHAIKTLAQLAGAGDASLFYELVGGREEFDKICPAEVADDLDVVALAGRIERALQKKARDEEDAATGADAKADACSAAANGVDMYGEHDSATLQQTLHAAIEAKSALEQKARDANKKLLEAGAARDALEDAEAEIDGPTIDQAEAKLATAREGIQAATVNLENANALVKAKERELEEARSALREVVSAAKLAENELTHAEQELTSARNRRTLLEGFRKTVEAAQHVEPVDEADLFAARQAVGTAQAAVEQGALIRNAIEQRTEGQRWREKAGDHRKKAEAFRQSAAGTDEVLSSLVSRLGSPLFVKRHHLMINSDRGEESFWELSDGERSEIAVTVFATRVGHNGLLALPQSFWEGLDWAGRRRIAEHMKRLGATAITAEADKDESEAGDLRAEVFQG